MKKSRAKNYLQYYIEKLQSEGKYSFSLEQVRKDFPGYSEEALGLSLNRLSKKGKIVSVYKGFYVIVPPEYYSQGVMPANLFVDSLMKFLGKEYHVSLVSAAAMHGAAHQQPQEFFIMTTKPAMRSTFIKGVKINYAIKQSIHAEFLEKRNTVTGYLLVSSPELTAIDLVEYEKRIGGLSRVTTILEELCEKIKVNKLIALMESQVPLSVLQRFGYILDVILENTKLADTVYSFLSHRIIHWVKLKPGASKKGFPYNTKWKIIVNSEIESDL